MENFEKPTMVRSVGKQITKANNSYTLLEQIQQIPDQIQPKIIALTKLKKQQCVKKHYSLIIQTRVGNIDVYDIVTTFAGGSLVINC